MPITKLEMANVTVFHKLSVEFCSGINVLVGENGLGKTHIMKILYAACQSGNSGMDFAYKMVRVFRPEDNAIRRLVTREKVGGNSAKVKVYSEAANIGMSFTSRTQKWKADITNEANWEKYMGTLNSVFIPAKEILSNAWNLESAVKMNNVEFDDTYLDIIAAAKVDVSKGNDSAERRKYLELLKKINNGKVTVSDERFYLKLGNQSRLEFNLVAEGIRKIALLWQLIKNGTLEKGSILFWDEPEANINPKHIPVIAEMLLLLQREGVQIFISTHDYFLTKYLEVYRNERDVVSFYSLYKERGNGEICVENKDTFRELENNSILATFLDLYHEELRKVMD